MTAVNIRELRNQGGAVVDRVSRGETITITRAGKTVAELRPAAPRALSAETLLSRWRALPPLSLDALRADLDEVLSPDL